MMPIRATCQAALGKDAAGANSGSLAAPRSSACQPLLGPTRLHLYGRGADADVLEDENGTTSPRMTLER